jgi:ADP-heptose:LPS heptosyltransferase
LIIFATLKKPFIYLIRKRALGDVLWIEPVIRQLAARYKKVIVHTKHNELFANYPLPNVVFKEKLGVAEKIWARLESIFNTALLAVSLDGAYEKRPKMHFLNAYQLQAGLPVTREYPQLYLSEAELKKDLVPAGKYAVLHIESFSDKNYRKIYGVDWDNVVEYLIEKGFRVVQLGKAPAPLKNVQHVRTSIREMMVVIKKSSLFIGIDSGPSHLAASVGTPALIFFGAIDPAFRHFRELLKGHILQQACEYAGCYHNATKKGEVDCRLVGNSGIPKCSLHTTEYVRGQIDLLIKAYHDH